MIRDGERYNGKVISCAGFFQSGGKGTTGFNFTIATDDDGSEIDYIIWITANTRERAQEDFATLGVSEDQLKDMGYLANRLPEDIINRPVSFMAKNEEYNGKVTMKATFLSKVRAGSPKQMVEEVAELFGAAPRAGGSFVPTVLDDDDSIPFTWLLPTLLGGGLYALLHAASTLT